MTSLSAHDNQIVSDIKKLIGCGQIDELVKRIVNAQALTTFGRSGNYSCDVGGVKFFVKLALYSLFIHDLWQVPAKPTMMMVDAEIAVMRAIKMRIIDPGISPHYAELLAVVKCDKIANYIHDPERCAQQQLNRVRSDQFPQSLLCAFMDLVDGGHALDKFALVMSEHCDFTIKDYFTRYAPAFPVLSDALIESITFQIYYTLAATQRVWPKFRHGDLWPHNIMIKLARGGEQYFSRRHYLRYRMDDTVWNVPFFGVFAKIIDFGHSEIPEENIHSSIKRARDVWVPDHIIFAINFEAILQECKLMTNELRLMFLALNREHLSTGVANVRLMQFESKFPRPEAALHLAFAMFRAEVDEKDVIREYRMSGRST